MEDLTLSYAPNAAPADRLATLEENERRHIQAVLEVTGGRLSEEDNEAASNLLRAFRSIYVMQHQITKLRREKVDPQIYIYPAVDQYRAGEFFKVRDIMADARPAKDELKRALEAAAA